MQELNKNYDHKILEENIYKKWENICKNSGYLNPDNLPGNRKKTFTIVAPPPNVTGALHMGHALNAVIQDILIRKKRMEGFLTLWLPGTDHAGIATQNVVEKDLKKQNIYRSQLGREKFLEKVWEWKEKYGNIILDQFKKIGASMDWSRVRFTMDFEYQQAVQAAFIHYFKKGLIYRAERIINWCFRCATSLSDLELEYKEEHSKLYYIKYFISGVNNYVIVATTRPETIFGDVAVAVNPKDKRYKNLIGQKVILPIQNREIPIIADYAVDQVFGTGIVKITPAHDMFDAEVATRHNLPLIKIIDIDGKMNVSVGPLFVGLKILECREKIIEILKNNNLLEKEDDYFHNVPVCYRCGTNVELIPSLQWFLKMDNFVKTAIKAVKSKEIKFYPKRWEKIYFNWLSNARDWCISRQIWWGHQLPVWFCKKQNQKFIVCGKTPTKCPFCKKCIMERSSDVLDTWFSSALWPFATLGWPKKTKDFRKFYPTQVLSTARDIINLWVTRMIYSGIEFINKKPFSDVIIHATILTKDGRRMSKSLGTGVDPINLINQYGADATRFGLIWQTMGNQDVHWSEEHVVAGKKFCNKIWNASKFVIINNSNINNKLKYKLTSHDKNIIYQFKKIKKEVENDINNYQFSQALHKIYHYFWHTFCDKIIEEMKPRLQGENEKDKQASQYVLLEILKGSLKLLHPFMPFITEEIWQNMPNNKNKMLMVEKW
ncbi:valine--tRNA ligase [Candidatus Wolfebacteria bacterium]|nr:valine--tRNA ligase [Candidatus Wolfebacteria bacterium]